MAKFCTKCGKELKDGKLCDCEVTKEEKVVSSHSSFDIQEYVNSYVDMLKGMFTKPVDTIKKFAKEQHFLLGVIALIINCIITGIFAYCFLSKATGFVGSLMGYGSLLTGSIQIPFFDVFFGAILFMAVGFSITALMLYFLGGLLLKDKMDLKKAFALVGVCSVFTTVTTLACILLTYVSIKLMLVVLIFAGVFYLTYLSQGIAETTKIEKNKLAYVFVVCIAVATLIVLEVLPRILF